MKKRSLETWVKDNRNEIDKIVCAKLGAPDKYKNDKERRLWVLNDESLYLWARSEGVEI